jgi:hypothetical protein
MPIRESAAGVKLSETWYQGEPMGYLRLTTLPKSQKWEHVVGLIAGGADVEQIASASADAAEHGLERASQDQGLAHAFWLLTQIPQAARQSDFADQLKRLGLEVSSKPTFFVRSIYQDL